MLTHSANSYTNLFNTSNGSLAELVVDRKEITVFIQEESDSTDAYNTNAYVSSSIIQFLWVLCAHHLAQRKENYF